MGMLLVSLFEKVIPRKTYALLCTQSRRAEVQADASLLTEGLVHTCGRPLTASAKGIHATAQTVSVETVRKRTVFLWPLGTVLWK